MDEGGCQGEAPLTQRGASSGEEEPCETRQKSRWLYMPELYHMEPSLSRPAKTKKKTNYTQIRVYLPNDTVRKLLCLPPALRTTVLSMRLRAMDWSMVLDPSLLKEGCGDIKESCALLRQAVTSGLIEPKDKEAFERLLCRLERLIHT